MNYVLIWLLVIVGTDGVESEHSRKLEYRSIFDCGKIATQINGHGSQTGYCEATAKTRSEAAAIK